MSDQASGLEKLEELVDRARSELLELRAANESLEHQLEESRAELEKVRSETGNWEEQRGEVQRRLDALAGDLEALLTEGQGDEANA